MQIFAVKVQKHKKYLRTCKKNCTFAVYLCNITYEVASS